MEYNTSREPIIYPEYGRNLQKLINKIIKIKEYEIKLLNIKNIYNFMININHNIRKYFTNYKKNIGIHLFYLSKKKILFNNLFKFKKIIYKRNINKKEIIILMKKIYIKTKKNKFKYYGKNIIIILFIISNLKKIKILFINSVLDLMKRKYLKWNKIKYINNNILYRDIYIITYGKINILNFIYIKKKLY
ncbi:MAG: DUF4290 domain-containing protein [Candidatus Shikimatogenerans bostrichidophilus]|nr:MAG: DUF4290 domain-containing protein [Candidatus Shikimatogenerans bostrichidophilus]